MLRIPVLGRLNFWDYYSLLLTSVLFCLESGIRIILMAIPGNWGRTRNKESPFENIGTAREFAEHWGYPFQEYIVKTTDGYFLGLHRIPGSSPPRSGEETDSPSDSSSSPVPTQRPSDLNHDPEKTYHPTPRFQKPVVLLWHGVMMNSEVFVCKPRQWENIAFVLADLGYDVWLGNTRGNKYSLKHCTRSPHQRAFWDFSLDEYAQYDLPATVDHILEITGMSSLTYIGFSQGTAQCFASLSIQPALNPKINLFICLAPATAPKGLENRAVNALIRATPNIIFLLFGRYSALPMTLFWQDLLPTNLFVWIIDWSLHFLFRWNTLNMSPATKHACYTHLYSMTSVKSIVHWFQIIRSSRFQFYDDFLTPPRFSAHSHTHVASPYPTAQIETPIAIFYGGSDTLTDMNTFFEQLPRPAFAKEVPHYEHLDFLWADDLTSEVFPELTTLLCKYNPGAQPYTTLRNRIAA